MMAIYSHPSKQQITNLIKYGVATGVTSAYNTIATNTHNESLSHQVTCNVQCNETAETSLFFCSFIVHTTVTCIASKHPTSAQNSMLWKVPVAINQTKFIMISGCAEHVI